MSKKYVGDFETATWLEEETYVWAWALCEIGSEENIIIDNSMESFIEYIQKENSIIYFHNLKFDGEFIIYYLLKNGYKHIKDKRYAEEKTFTTLISDMGLFYSIEIYFTKRKNKQINKVTIYDSLKILPFSVDVIAKSFDLPIRKLELDYNKKRERGHNLTSEEIDYIKNDVVIVSKALNIMFKEGLTKMTIGSNALQNFREKTKYFNKLFPKLSYELYEDLKQAYKGGFTYLNDKYKNKEVSNGCELDVNSLYPSCMRYKLLPFGNPLFFNGKYEEDKSYPLYIQRIVCSFELKENKIPTIQIKNSMSFMENEYLKSSNNEIVVLTLTNIDLKLFLEQYDVYDLEYICGWKFKGSYGIFDEYIDYWTERKNKATLEGNKGIRQLSKLMLNSLYGKFATGMKVSEKYPYLEDDIVRYELSEETEKDGLYIPIGAFITSYAREITQRTSQAITDYSLKKYGKDLYFYSDTDSVKCGLSLSELKEFCDIDDIRLGAWKQENQNPLNPEYSFIRAKFIRQKCYLAEHIDKEGNKEISITCAGLPQECYKYVEWDKFKEGFTCGGKFTFKHLKGGVKLVETDFTIKSDNFMRGHIRGF